MFAPVLRLHFSCILQIAVEEGFRPAIVELAELLDELEDLSSIRSVLHAMVCLITEDLDEDESAQEMMDEIQTCLALAV